MPRVLSLREKNAVSKTWSCPVCKAEIRSTFDGGEVSFSCEGVAMGGCSGMYESVAVQCPRCKSYIEFSKEEVEKP
jgi:hypothetical protein